MMTARDVLADLLDSPEFTRRRGGFAYDPDLAKFGNAVSPFVPFSSDSAANLAMQRRFDDRYSSRYDQPDATDYLMMSLDQMNRAGSGDVYVGNASATAGIFDTFSEKTGIGIGTVIASMFIVGTTGLLAARNPKHVIEIAAVGAAGVAFALALNAKKSGALR